MEDDERKALLFPSWATNGNSPRYDDLSDADKAVWRATRGQREDADSHANWLRQLVDAVNRGDISDDDARLAIKRVGKWV